MQLYLLMTLTLIILCHLVSVILRYAVEIFQFQAFKTLQRRFFSTNTSGNLKYELIVESAESLLNFSELF